MATVLANHTTSIDQKISDISIQSVLGELKFQSFEINPIEKIDTKKNTFYKIVSKLPMINKKFKIWHFKNYIFPSNIFPKYNAQAIEPMFYDILKKHKIDAIIFNSLQVDHNLSSNIAVFDAEPVMSISINPKWSNIHDYKTELSAKYRTRFNKIIDLCNDFQISINETINNEWKNKLLEYYSENMKSKSLMLNQLSINDIEKITLLNEAHYFSFYCNQNLIARGILVLENDELYFPVLGFDEKFNKTNKLYNRILIYALDEAIKMGAKTLNLARTATEIKSTLGAMPIENLVYVMSSSKMFTRTVLKPISCYLKPKEFIIRQPFKSK